MKTIEGDINAERLKFAVIQSKFNNFITDRLLNGALECLRRHNAAEDNIDIYKVPGAFEIPVLAEKLAESKKYNAIICLGAIIRGGTPHFEYVSLSSSLGILNASIKNLTPIAFGVLTTDNLEQAIERSGSESGNKGYDAALTAIEMAELFSRL
ncbi:MAG: 6,7-dimethyl-8-ribityllumazine synthase [Ignavibacteriaceae bacterium]|nr:6,7-dimethyl-8-ribityllumazine synthase [Ignavibacteriaceae bacterium]